MKKVLILLMMGALVYAASAQSGPQWLVAENVTEAAFNWDEGSTHDLGKIVQNKEVTHLFTFTNVGNSPLVINSVKASCGCTVTSYSEEPIAPGEQGMVAATYNAKKLGTFTKSVVVNANTGNPVTLYLKGEVIAAAK